MDMIIIDSNLQDIGPSDCEYDMEVGLHNDATNDFMMKTTDPVIVSAYGCYLEGTEYGGLFEEIRQSTDSNETTILGETWRGLLAKATVLPTSGIIRAVSGDANTILSGLLNNVLGGLFVVPSESSGVTITNYEMSAYNPILNELDTMLTEYNAKLVIKSVKVAGVLRLSAEIKPAVNIAGEYNADNDIPLDFVDYRRGFNHCIAVGGSSGGTVIHLYADASGNISTTQTYTGIQERTMAHLNTSLSNSSELKKEATEAFKEVLNYKSLDIDDAQAEDMGDIGDIITGTRGDLTVQSPIARKVIAYKNGRQTITCNIKGGD